MKLLAKSGSMYNNPPYLRLGVIPSTSQNTEAHKNNDILQSLDIQNIKIPLSVGELEMQTQEVSVNQDTETEPLAEQSYILDTLIESQILPDQTGPETEEHLHNSNDALYATPASSTIIWDVTGRKNLKSKKHPALSVNVQKKSMFDDLTQAKMELVHLQKSLLESEIMEKNNVWAFEENERKKEALFIEKQRQLWELEENDRRKELDFNDNMRKLKEEELKLKIDVLRKELNK